ncbi:MAG: hypothetical protein U1D35_00920 [Paracoccaceae bacterium]|nr:hypothetical protein [Paracoccaceae bacterium]
MSTSPHFTTRRAFVGVLGFGGVSLYGLWVGYGAAPGPLALLRPSEAGEMPMPGGDSAMAGHGADPSGPDIEAFRTPLRSSSTASPSPMALSIRGVTARWRWIWPQAGRRWTMARMGSAPQIR